MEMNRRDLCIAMTAFASLSALTSLAAQAQEQEMKPASADSTIDMSQSQVFHFDSLKVTKNANGGWGRPVLHGTLPTGEFVEVHETMLPPGKMPHPPHKHRDSEFILIREGQLEFYNEGKPEPAGPGDVIYTASNRMHGLKNVGTTPAMYFVVAISRKQV